MIYLVTGASASGKSEYAEKLAVMAGDQRRYYLATMSSCDDESRRRIARHQAMRRDKGFTTVERCTDLAGLKLPGRGTVLLECMSNLTANEMYLPDGAGEDTIRAVMRGIRNLDAQADHLIIVTNEVFSDGAEYDEFTRKYLQILGRINCETGKMADVVAEIVCSIPIIHKGAEYVEFI